MRISDWSSDVCSADLRRVRWGVRFVMIGLVPDHLARPQHAAILNDSAARGENGDYIGDEGPRQRQQPLPPAIAARGEMQAHAEPPEQQRGGEAEQQAQRSEEHTSELQSLMRISYAVFCLKKKKKQRND